jgi:hypothetical protein
MFDAAVYYDDCRGELGSEFLDEVEAMFSLIKAHFEIGRMIGHSCRRMLLVRFPYGVIYRERGDILYVVAIMHLKREPGYWLDRIRETDL